MTDPLGAGPGDRAPGPAAAVRPVAARGRMASFGLGRLLRWWLVIGALLLLAIAVFIAISGVAFDFQPLHIAISGDDFSDGIRITGMTAGAKALLAAAAVVVILVALLIVPLVLLLVFAAVSVGLIAALLGTAIGLAAATSPIWIVGLIVWWLVRRRRRHSLIVTQEGAIK